VTHTHTHTYTVTVPANPYLVCDWCRGRVEGFIDGEGPARNYPCEHKSGYESVCPSWGPVDGCECPKGSRPHGDPTPAKTEQGQEQGPL
jgi:hypothetical protein